MIDRAIADLIRYAEEKKLIAPEDRAWALNSLLEVLKLDSWTDPGPVEAPGELAPVLELIETPARFPPKLKPTLFLPTLNRTPGAILKLFLNRKPMIYTPS